MPAPFCWPAFGLGWSMRPEWFLIVLTAAVVLPAAVVDLLHRRIPNELCLAGILLGISFNIVNDGLAGSVSSLAGLAIAFSFGFPLWLMGWFGAGDAKLASAVGAIVGLDLVFPVMAGIAIAGGAVALLYLLAMRALREPLGAIIASAVFPGVKKESSSGVVSDLSMKGIPYAIPVAFGSLAAIVYMY